MAEISIHVDESDVLSSHLQMRRELLAEIEKAARASESILVGAIVDDLESKILRPRESDGTLARNIPGEVFWENDDLIIGIGHEPTLDIAAPHWRLQDQGGPIAVKAVQGYFVDIGGKRVDFRSDAAGATTSGAPPYFQKSKESLDLFVYKKDSGSIMYITSDVKPKRYFESGSYNARGRVEALFTAALNRVLPK